jgi:YVTN family beta-propeller protein
MTDLENRIREALMDSRRQLPTWPDPMHRIRRSVRRQRVRLAVATTLPAVAVMAAAIPAVNWTLGQASGARPAAPTVYAAYDRGNCSCGEVIPVNTATNKAGKPIRTGFGFQIAIRPDGKTAYVLNPSAFTVVPVSTATNTAGKPIPVGRSGIDSPSFIAITPDGKTVYVANTGRHTVVPVSTATNTAGKPIPVGSGPQAIAITPDGKTAYVVSYPTSGNGPATVTPISTATNTVGKPIRVGFGSFEIAITPDGKTAYAYSGSTVTPVSTATNTAGTPIHLHGNFGEGAIAINPDGKTLYALTINPDTVVPVSTATNTAGTPIRVHLLPSGITGFAAEAASQFTITPDGKTAYLLTGGDSVIPISTVTNTAGKTIQFGSDCRSQAQVHPNISLAITPDGKTAYVACESAVIPISTATNTPGRPIPVPLGDPDTIAITP